VELLLLIRLLHLDAAVRDLPSRSICAVHAYDEAALQGVVRKQFLSIS
jgi:hypothetical protein